MRRKYSWPIIAVCSLLLLSLALIDSGQLWGQRTGSQTLVVASDEVYIFRLQLQQGVQEDYTECMGLGSSNTIDEATGVSNNGIVFTEKSPGTLEWHNITLRRDGPSDPDLWQWRRAMEELDLNTAIQDGTITMFTAGSADPVAQWSFTNGWAARLTFNGSREELVIAHEELRRIDPGSGMSTAARR